MKFVRLGETIFNAADILTIQCEEYAGAWSVHAILLKDGNYHHVSASYGKDHEGAKRALICILTDINKGN